MLPEKNLRTFTILGADGRAIVGAVRVKPSGSVATVVVVVVVVVVVGTP